MQHSTKITFLALLSLISINNVTIIFHPIHQLMMIPLTYAEMFESDRVREYHRRKHKWPPEKDEYKPTSWYDTFRNRWDRLMEFDDSENDDDDKWSGFKSLVHSALVCPNFTEYGWGLTKAPKPLVDELLHILHAGLAESDLEEEEYDESDIEEEHPHSRPLWISLPPRFDQRALQSLEPIISSWSNMTVTPNNVYGLRVYRNQSNLLMHVDQPESHIISGILHVDHDPTSDPWPIVIEDYRGKTNEVLLERGDLLLYESSKCMHGRPRRFNGAWYTSLFVHFHPEDWDGEKISLDSSFRVPPSWDGSDDYDDEYDPDDEENTSQGEQRGPENDKDERGDENVEQDSDQLALLWKKTSMEEPSCEHGWCGLANSEKWYGPAQAYGKVLSADGVLKTLDVPDGGGWD